MPPREYLDADGKVVPSVTTIIRSGAGGWGTEGLIRWAWQRGMEGVDYEHIRDQAATVGTIAHLRIEAFVTNREPDLSIFPPELIRQSEAPIESFLEWYTSNPMLFHTTELKLSHPRYRYGGTMDAVVQELDQDDHAGRRLILDYKSGRGVYAEVIAQLAAYQELWEANYANAQTHEPFRIDAAKVLHVSREGHFAVYDYDAADLQLGRDLFFNLLSQYELKKQAERIHKREQKRHAAELQIPGPVLA